MKTREFETLNGNYSIPIVVTENATVLPLPVKMADINNNSERERVDQPTVDFFLSVYEVKEL